MANFSLQKGATDFSSLLALLLFCATGEETASRSAFQRKSHAVGEGQELAPSLVKLEEVFEACTEQVPAPHLSLSPSR